MYSGLKRFLGTLGIDPWKLRAAGQRWAEVLHDLYQYRTYPMFSVVAIETSSQCNRRCAVCPVSIQPRTAQSYLPADLYEKILRELAAIRFSGRLALYMYNEPLMDEGIVEKIRLARGFLPKAFLNINSNGDFLTAEKVRILREAGLSSMLVTAYTESARQRLEKLYGALDPAGRKIVTLRHKLDFIGNRAGSVEAHEIPEPVKADCFLPSQQFVVNYKGEVLICCNDYFAQHVVGNLTRQSMLEIWRGPHMRNVRRLLRRKQRDAIEICRGCNLISTPYQTTALEPSQVQAYNLKH